MAPMGTTIFAEMSALAVATGSVNLGQGFPDTDGPAVVAEAAADGDHGRAGQPVPARARHARAAAAPSPRTSSGSTAWTSNPDTEVLVTAGATEAIAAALLALTEPGDEVIAFEPYYDSYAACIALAGAVRVPVTLRPPGFRPDLDALRAAITPRTRLILLNTPHNPTGAVLQPGRAHRDRGPGRRARPAGDHRRGVRAHGVRRRARADRDAAGHARAGP